MKGEQKFFRCNVCGNIVGLVVDGGAPMICCGQEMEELKANTVDAAVEKHVPYVTQEGDVYVVQVGEMLHPMLEEHYIEWIYVQTEQGGQRKGLRPGDVPKGKFTFVEDKPVAVYEYCNLHGLWKKEL